MSFNIPLYNAFCIAILIGMGIFTMYRIIYLRLNFISINVIQLLFFVVLILYSVVMIFRLVYWM